MTGSLARRLAVAVTVVIVIVDIVLIGTAVRGATGSRASGPASAARTGTPAYPAPEMIVPTRLGASMRPSPVPAPRSSPAVAAPRSSPATAPTIEVLGESRTVGEESAPLAVPLPGLPRGDDDAASRPLLAVSPDGAVIRATRGSCPADGSAGLEISADLGRTWTPVASSAAQVLRVDAMGGGDLRIVATDRSCRPVARHSTDGGETWQPGGLSGIWYLSPDSDADQVLGPALVSTVGCVPHALAATDDEHAAVSCADGTVRVTDDGGDDWREVAGLSGVTSLVFTGDGDGYALAAADGCATAVLRTSGQPDGWSTVACLDEAVAPAAIGTRPQAAIAAAGTVVAVQIGAVFLLSTDAGATWTDPAR